MEGILDKILKEVKASKKRSPSWPDHVVAQAGMVESSSLLRSAIRLKYSKRSKQQKELQTKHLENQAIMVAANAIRFIENLKK